MEYVPYPEPGTTLDIVAVEVGFGSGKAAEGCGNNERRREKGAQILAEAIGESSTIVARNITGR